MNFNNRKEYLAAVALWKLKYRELSDSIRVSRAGLKEQQRNGEHPSSWKHKKLKDKATEMLCERAAGKVEAQKQYLREREKKIAA